MDKLKRKKVLYISYDGMTDPLGQSQVLPYICGLSKKGYHFTLISCEKKARFEKLKKIIYKICEDNSIDWQPLIYHKKPPVLSTLWDLIAVRRLSFKLNRSATFELVHCRGYIAALVGLSMKRKSGTRFLFDMRGFWADEKVDAGSWDLKSPVFKGIYKFFKKKEKQFLEESDAIISLTLTGKTEMLNWNFSIAPDKITIIPCCADTELFDFNKTDTALQALIRRETGIAESEYIVSYLGSIGTWYMLEEMLDFFEAFLQVKPNAKFLFITFDEQDRIMNEAKKRNIDKKIILRPAERSEVPVVLSLSQLSLFFIRNTYSKKSSSPTKQGEIMSMGIPVICNSGVGDTDSIVNTFHSGIVNKEFSKSSYDETIATFFSTYFEKEKIREGALNYFKLENGISQYQEVYKKII